MAQVLFEPAAERDVAHLDWLPIIEARPADD
jgi:hypothetical protein